MPKLLGSIFDKDNLGLASEELTDLRMSKLLIHDVNKDERRTVEKTKSQANSNICFLLRAGGITASELKTVCAIKTSSPSVTD